MPPLDYLLLRIIRRHLPSPVMRFLLRHHLLVKPGMETRIPDQAVRRFVDTVASAGRSVVEGRVLIFGYGGALSVAVGLLQAGARHVVLVDPYARPPRQVNLALARGTGARYLRLQGNQVSPDPAWITLVHAPVQAYLESGGEPADIVLSNSVLEHVDRLDEVVPQLARATAPDGEQYHFVDLRDHYYRYPFEMLCWSEAVWRGRLNPGSNLNRLRVADYRRIFCGSFGRVELEAVASDPERFRAARPRIRPEFLTRDDAADAITRIVIRASVPLDRG